MDDLLLKTLLEGGALAIFVVFVIYNGRQVSVERKALVEALVKIQERHEEDMKQERDRSQLSMARGLDAIDRVGTTISDLTKATSDLTNVIGKHDASSQVQLNEISRKLDKISNGG
jgi:hypothetical protein